MTEKPTTKKLTQTLNKGLARLESHIGGNGNAHLAATEEMSGFMSGADKRIVDAFGREPKVISDGTDIFNLQPGYYMSMTGKLLSLPDEAIEGTNYIEVSSEKTNPDYGKITLYNLTTEKVFHAYKQGWNQGKWHWLRYEKKESFGGDLASSGSNYSIYHLDTTTLFSATINANVRLGPHNYARIVTAFPGSLRPDRKIYVIGMAQTDDNIWESSGVTFNEDGSLTIVNMSDKTITRTFAEMLFTYNEIKNVALK